MDNLSTKVIAIQQPNYLPWSGYFYKLSKCDTFVLLDHVEINKRGYTRRTLIPDNNKPGHNIFLTVPLIKFSDSAAINTLLIDHSKKWPAKHLNSITQCYKHAPFFEHHFDFVEKLLESASQYELLSDWNIFVIKEIAKTLQIEKKWVLSSDLSLTFKKNELNAAIVHKLHGSIYLCGDGAKNNYSDENYFRKNLIELVYSNYISKLANHPYRADTNAIRTSILDILFWLGNEGAKAYFETDLK